MINKKIASEIALGIIVLLAIVVGGIFWMQSKKMVSDPREEFAIRERSERAPIGEGGVMCTQDVKLCDDGSYVSRTGQNCEFAQCPVINTSNNELNVEGLIPDTFQVLTQNEIANWKTYSNKKYGYQLRYPDSVECIEDLGVRTIPDDQLWCSFINSDGKNRLYLSIFPIAVKPGQDQITFNPVVGVGGVDITVKIKNGDIIDAIYEKLKDVDSFKAEYPFLERYSTLKTDEFKPFYGVGRIIGFSNINISNTGVLIGRSPGKSTREYERAWFFVRNNVLFQLYAHYDDTSLYNEGTDENFREQITRIPDLEKVFSTMTFSR
ncbi:MAG: hypothetical protein ACD_5C00100G0003 [uncultured bacterium]|nr:MAG: hypothetical protein ACD_5C00100G0003 [uncultured bacterium]